MNSTCNRKELVFFLFQVQGILNWTIYADRRYELSGTEGRFLQLLIDYLDVPLKFISGNETEFYLFMRARKIDMAVGRFNVDSTSSTANVSPPFETNYVTFAIRKSVPLATRFAFLYTFNLTTWLGFVMVLILLPVFVLMLMKKKKISYLDICLQLLGSLLRQAYPLSVSSLKTRTIFFSWLFFAMVVSSSYSSAFFSFMMNPLKYPPVRNFDELFVAVTSGNRRCYIEETKYLTYSIGVSSYAQLLHVKNGEYSISINYDHAHEDVLIQGHIVVGQYYNINLMFGLNSEVYISDDKLNNKKISSYLFFKKFCLKKKVNKFFKRAWTAGLYQKIVKDEQMKIYKASRMSASENPVRSLALIDISGITILFIVGLIISSFVLVMEIIVYNCRKLF